MGARYRVAQFWRAVRARPLSGERWVAVAAILSPEEQALFRRYTPNDQHHCLRVMETLLEHGERDRDVLTAALLHDIGKSVEPLNLLERTLVVLALALVPSWAERWGRGEPAGWQRPFVVKARHAEWGARLAATSGCSPRAVALIRHHQDNLTRTAAPPALLPSLRRLQLADDLH